VLEDAVEGISSNEAQVYAARYKTCSRPAQRGSGSAAQQRVLLASCRLAATATLHVVHYKFARGILNVLGVKNQNR
jgi:hypothetical protein